MNTIQSLLFSPLVQALGVSLLHFLWQGLLITALLASILRRLHHRTAQARYFAACTALVMLAACPVVTMLALQNPWVYLSGTSQTFQARQMPASVHLRFFESGPSLITAPVVTHFQQVDPPFRMFASKGGGRVYSLLVVSWLMSVLCLSLRLLGGWLYVRRLTRCDLRVVEKSLQDRVTDMARRMGISRTVRVVESARVGVPAVIGCCLQATVLLPVSVLTGLSARQLESIIAHELAHIRRHDYLINLLQTALETLLFYHPATWWVSRQIRQERENCCDDMAVQFCGSRVLYARALATLEDLRYTPASFAIGADGGNLLQRIRRIAGMSSPLREPFHPWGQAAIASLTILVLVCVVASPAALVRASSPSSATQRYAETRRSDARPLPLHNQKRSTSIMRGLARQVSALLHDPTSRRASKQAPTLFGSAGPATAVPDVQDVSHLYHGSYVPSSGAADSEAFGTGTSPSSTHKATRHPASANSFGPQADASAALGTSTRRKTKAASSAFAEPEGLPMLAGKAFGAPRAFPPTGGGAVLRGGAESAPGLPNVGCSAGKAIDADPGSAEAPTP